MTKINKKMAKSAGIDDKSDAKPIQKSDDTKSPTIITSCPFDTNICRQALVGMKKLIETAQIGHKQLLDNETPISLYLHVHKIPRCTYFRLSAQLPHPIYPLREICLFVRDDDVTGRDFDATVRRYKTMIEKFQLPYIIDVMTLKQLNQELVPYEAKRKLCSRYDLFLADRRILSSLMRGQLLGKHFRHRGKMPLGINVFNKDLKERLKLLCESIQGRMAGTGPLFSIQFTNVKQTIDESMENFSAVCEAIGQQLPGGWMNIHHAYLYGNNFSSLSIYYSKHTKNDLSKLNLSMADDFMNQTEVGELSTIENNRNVIVKPNGQIKFTSKKKLEPQLSKPSSLKRLSKRITWYNEKKIRPARLTSTPKTKINDELSLPSITDNKQLIDTSFIDRILEKKLAKRNKKPKHVEHDFAAQPAPRAEKRKQLLAASSLSTTATTTSTGDMTEKIAKAKKQKSGGRSKPRVNGKK